MTKGFSGPFIPSAAEWSEGGACILLSALSINVWLSRRANKDSVPTMTIRVDKPLLLLWKSGKCEKGL